MPNKIKMKDVLMHLELDEPDYVAAAKLGPDALPLLDRLLDGKNTMIASKATYLASLIKHSTAREVLRHAATHNDPIVRVAAAAAVRNIAVADANTVLETLVGDSDAGVRKVAIKSVPDTPSPSLKLKVESVAADETEPDLSALCHETLNRIGSRQPDSSKNEATDTGGVGMGGGDLGDTDTPLSYQAEAPDVIGMGGGDLGDTDTPLSDQAEAPDEIGMGGGDLNDSDTPHSDQSEDLDEFGGGDGSIDVARGVRDISKGVSDADSPLGFGGGQY